MAEDPVLIQKRDQNRSSGTVTKSGFAYPVKTLALTVLKGMAEEDIFWQMATAIMSIVERHSVPSTWSPRRKRSKQAGGRAACVGLQTPCQHYFDAQSLLN